MIFHCCKCARHPLPSSSRIYSKESKILFLCNFYQSSTSRQLLPEFVVTAVPSPQHSRFTFLSNNFNPNPNAQRSRMHLPFFLQLTMVLVHTLISYWERLFLKLILILILCEFASGPYSTFNRLSCHLSFVPFISLLCVAEVSS